MPDNLPACFFAPRVTLRTALRAVAVVPGFALLARDLAAVDLLRADVAFLGFARDLAAAGFVRRDVAVLARPFAAALRTVPALRAGWAAFLAVFLAVGRRFDFFFATGI